MKKTLASLAAFGLALSSTIAVAQDPLCDFATADSDNSGSVSYVEISTLMPNVTEEDFRLADTDGNEELSVEEYDAFVTSCDVGSGSSDTEDDADADDDAPEETPAN